jgi:hypothetical protein
VLCASLPSSGSTWLFNAVAELLRHTAVAAQPDQVAQFYADRMADFPELVEMPDYLVVKTHTADAPLRLLWRIAGGPLLITVREPRDAVASLMSRFGFPFDIALKNVQDAAACMVDLAAFGASLILRYEDRFASLIAKRPWSRWLAASGSRYRLRSPREYSGR